MCRQESFKLCLLDKGDWAGQRGYCKMPESLSGYDFRSFRRNSLMQASFSLPGEYSINRIGF